MDEKQLFEQLKFNDDEKEVLYARKGYLVDDNAQGSSVVFIKRGKVEVKSISGQLLSILNSGEVYGISNLFLNTTLHTKLSVIEDAELCFVEKEIFKARLLESKEAIVAYSELMNEKLNFLLDRITILSLKSNRERVRSFIKQGLLASSSRTVQAAYLGISRSAFFLELKHFESKGAIRTDGRKIIIIDEKLLED